MHNFLPVFVNGEEHAKTVRVSTCEMLINGNRCSFCVAYRDSLRSRFHHWLSLSPSKRQSTRSRTNLRWLNTPEKAKHCSQLRSRLDAKSKEVKWLRDKIIGKNHLSLDATLHSDFRNIMTEMSKKVQEECAENSFRRLFWEEQLKAASVKNIKQVQWHPAIIKWCLHLKFLSSEQTLRDFTHCIHGGISQKWMHNW